MARFEHPIIDEVAAVGFPFPEEVMVSHGSAMVVRGMREEHDGGDIDLVVSRPNIIYLREELGWQAERRRHYYDEALPSRIRSTMSPTGRIEVFTHDFVPEEYILTGRGRLYWNELVARHNSSLDQDTATGIWVASALHIAATKRFTGRKKDELDLRRLDQFLELGY